MGAFDMRITGFEVIGLALCIWMIFDFNYFLDSSEALAEYKACLEKKHIRPSGNTAGGLPVEIDVRTRAWPINQFVGIAYQKCKGWGALDPPGYEEKHNGYCCVPPPDLDR